MAIDEHPRLGCGRSIDDVWAGIDRPPDAHEAGCEQCRAARASLQTLRSITARQRTLEETAATDPDASLRPSSRVLENVLAVARAEVRRGRRIPAATTELGPVLVSEQALVTLVRLAADSVPGVRTRRIEVTPRRRTDGGLGYDPGAPVLDAVTCRIAISPTVSVPRVSTEIRHRVTAVLSRHMSVDPGAVNIVVEDLYDA